MIFDSIQFNYTRSRSDQLEHTETDPQRWKQEIGHPKPSQPQHDANEQGANCP